MVSGRIQNLFLGPNAYHCLRTSPLQNYRLKLHLSCSTVITPGCHMDLEVVKEAGELCACNLASRVRSQEVTQNRLNT